MAAVWKSVFATLVLLFAAVSGSGHEKSGVRVSHKVNADLNEERVDKVMQFAVSQHNKVSHDDYFHRMSKVISAQLQVVSGLKYFVTAEMSQTSCKKGETEGLENCAFYQNPKAKTYTCTFEIWSRPWIKDTQLLKNECA
ncbi:cystatin-like [Erpetoichthys calabaricus]|uniref:Cystatin-like n=1 Tax=Erpetoichthys calabaricus TaxID=27687 RepID=A0A8C4SPJ2_ERPCA|nr:cystatin-like [Erpetoichthys calabaricus]